MSVNSSKLTKDKADRFNTYINKVIVLSSKEFYRREARRNSREQKIIDDDDFDESTIKSLSYNEKFDIRLTDLIDDCENDSWRYWATVFYREGSYFFAFLQGTW